MRDSVELATDPVVMAVADLAEARAKLEAVREALQRAMDASGGDPAAIRQAEARLDRMAAEMARIEGVVAGQAAEVS